MKHNILTALSIVAVGILTSACIAAPRLEAKAEPSEPTPSITSAPLPTSTPMPTVIAENSPILTPEPTSTPIPQLTYKAWLVTDSDSFYKGILKSLKYNVEDLVCVQTEWSNGELIFIVMAKINGQWEIIEISNG